MKMTERSATWRREHLVLPRVSRVSRAAWRLKQAGRERSEALASEHAEGVSIRALAAAAGLWPSRLHQIVAAAGLDELDAALGRRSCRPWRLTPPGQRSCDLETLVRGACSCGAVH